MKKITLLLAALFFSIYAFSQEKIYYSNKSEAVDSPENAKWYKTVTENKESGITVEKCYTIEDDRLFSVDEYSNYQARLRDGKSEHYNGDGSPAFVSHYKNGKLHGLRQSYWRKDVLRREEHYADGVMKNGKCFDKQGNEIPFFAQEQKPEYPGGKEKLALYIKNHFKKKAKDTGRIIVQFVVEKDGGIVEARILKGINPKLDEEALRVVNSMAKWKPGMQEGIPVRVQFALPITLGK